MLSALSAEATKLSRHKATWFLVWIYPLGILALLLLGMAIESAQPVGPSRPQSAASWISNTSFIWFVPASGFGRYLIAAYLAVAIAGEYSWNTWKLVVPHRSRTALLAAKLVTVSAFLYLALIPFSIASYARVRRLRSSAATPPPASVAPVPEPLPAPEPEARPSRRRRSPPSEPLP